MKKITLHDKTFELYIPHNEIIDSIKKIAVQIKAETANEEPIFLSVLNGSFMFAADLMKYIDFNCQLSFVKLSSYEGTESTGKIHSLIGLNQNLAGKTVIILEDIVDRGVTLEHIVNTVSALNPKQIKIATMLYKPDAYEKDIKIDYIGLSIPNDFIVGYGLDYNELGRNYCDIYKIITY